ncbi:MAG: bifunctional DNA-formamidopyrimidine glycosylase/DNA-(apurinic or apyrimidinic site) lyase [Methylotenera sp.]|nr:bifunctional DNA-formamidopyrimidine glycosylase/DNA-(apurinic or apyrimidinic site) lyase [Methylotenera sp.]
MPELPEVEVTRLGLLPLLQQTVTSVTIRNGKLRWPIPADLHDTLSQQTLLQLTRRAKYILAQFERGVLILHLGMSGRLRLMAQFEPPQKHDHLDIQFTSGQVLRLRDPRRFGAVLWIDGLDATHPLLNTLGPEPLGQDFHAHYLHRQLKKKNVAIKIALMDSHVVVGIGNIYASEALFRARISPQLPAKKLSLKQCEALVQEVKTTLSDALIAGGSSLRDFLGADNKAGYFQQSYFVYGRTGEPCRVCHTPIMQIKQGQRSTFYCPVCQK